MVFVGAITGRAPRSSGRTSGRCQIRTSRCLGPDGVNEKTWADGAGSAANGTYLTFGGVDVSQLMGAGKTWADAYIAANNGTQPPFYAAYGHAAGEVVLAGLTKAGTNDRYAVLQAIMGTTALDTVIGSFTLDPNGDPKGGVISSYLMGAAWPPVYKGVITRPRRKGAWSLSQSSGRAHKPAPERISTRQGVRHPRIAAVWINSSRRSSSDSPMA